MQNFSVYELIENNAPFTDSVAALTRYSNEIEREVLENQLKVTMYVSFQRMRVLKRLMPKYQQLAGVAETIWAIGVSDCLVYPPENVRLVRIAAHSKLAREWIVLAHHANYSRALIAQEIAQSSRERIFTGVMLDDPEIIKKIVSQLYYQISLTTW